MIEYRWRAAKSINFILKFYPLFIYAGGLQNQLILF